MKEKQSFWDFIYMDNSYFFISIFFTIIFFAVSMHHCVVEIHSYSPEAFERLDEVSNSIIKEGIGIDLSAIPDDIENFRLEKNADEIILSYSLDNNLEFMKSAHMKITLSKDNNIISKETNYKSEKQYIASAIFYIIFKSIALGFIEGLIVWFFIAYFAIAFQ